MKPIQTVDYIPYCLNWYSLLLHYCYDGGSAAGNRRNRKGFGTDRTGAPSRPFAATFCQIAWSARDAALPRQGGLECAGGQLRYLFHLLIRDPRLHPASLEYLTRRHPQWRILCSDLFGTLGMVSDRRGELV